MNQAMLCLIEGPGRSYQPSRAELREELQLKGTFEEVLTALVRPVKLGKVMPAKL